MKKTKHKNKKSIFLLVFAALTAAFVIIGCNLNNPIIDEWWEGGPPEFSSGGRVITFQHEAYVVSFDAARGSYVDLIAPVRGNNPPNQRVLANTAAAVPGLVERDGYFFKGWFTDGMVQWDFDDTVTDDDVDQEGFLYLEAGWEGSGYTIHFDTNHPGGGVWAAGELTYTPKDEKIALDAKVAEPLHFGLTSKAEYIFNGWYTEPECTNAWDFSNDKADEAADTVGGFADDNVIILFAGWAEIPGDVPAADVYTVVFKSGTNNSPPNQYVAKGKKLIAPYVVQRDGYSFGGWYKDSECTDDWDFANDTVTENITLYAKWFPVNPVDIFKDLRILYFNYVLFAGGSTTYNGAPAEGNASALTPGEVKANAVVIASVRHLLETNPEYRVMVIGHANPTTNEDHANPLNPGLMEISDGRVTAVKAQLANINNYDTAKTPILENSEGGRQALKDPALSRRGEIVVFDITTKVQ